MSDRRLTRRNLEGTDPGRAARDTRHPWLHPTGMGPDRTASNATLIQHYTDLLESVTFRRLDRVVTSNQAIILENTSLLPPQHRYYRRSVYMSEVHAIGVSLTDEEGNRLSEDIRGDIVWEMHNASLRSAVRRSIVPDSDPSASPEEQKVYRYKLALYALSFEWEEWINTVECWQCFQSINDEGIQITADFEDEFAESGQGWFKFSKYLKKQLASHTTRYDAAAADTSWVGKRILSTAQANNPASLIITPKQLQDRKIGRTKKVKSPSNNPFTSFAIIEQARRGSL